MEIMLIDLFHCDPSDISIIIGDTDRVPHSGSSTASRSTTMAWMALQRLKVPFLEAILQQAERLSGIPAQELTTGVGGIRRKIEINDRAEQGSVYVKADQKAAGELVISYHELASQSVLEELIFDTHFHISDDTG